MFTTGHNLTTAEVLNLPIIERSKYLKHVLDHSPGKYDELRADMARLRYTPRAKDTLERIKTRRREREIQAILHPVELSTTDKELLLKHKGYPQELQEAYTAKLHTIHKKAEEKKRPKTTTSMAQALIQQREDDKRKAREESEARYRKAQVEERKKQQKALELLSEIKDQPNLYMSTPLGTFRVRSTELYDLNKQRTNIEADIGHQLHTKVSIIPGEDTQQDVDAVIGIDILTIYSEIRLDSSFS